MKPQDSVSIVTGAVKLPPSVTAYLQNNAEAEDECIVNGGILQDTQYAWLSSGSKFTVVNVTTGLKIAAWTFGSTLRDFKSKITCVHQLPTPLLNYTMQILIGLECELIGGMVCLFHCNGSRIIRAIQVACRVTRLQYVEDFPGGPLDCFDGTVIIGTHGGAVLAFDLNRQSCVEAILNGSSGLEDLIKDESNIANLVVLSIDDIGLIAEQREIACSKEDHIAVQINEGCIHNLQYILHNPDNTIRLRDDRENVFVSSLLYVPQLNSVILGLNFGVFQLWNLLTLQLEFTSHVNADKVPITHLGFLEPCDDPRAFCYLWAIYSSIDRHDIGFPLATMYALTYHGKTTLKGQGSLYENFATCNLRFNVDLTSVSGVQVENANSIHKEMVGGRSLACHTLIKDAVNADHGDESVLNICQMVWECWPKSAIAPVQSLMILFDIDQWYKEQMPDCSTLETNRYMSVVNLSNPLAHTASSYLCDVRINTESLAPYYAVQRLEEHFYPNALGYECCCLTNTDITRICTTGVQGQILASINETGPSVLLHPTKLFMQCVNSGLIPLYIEPTPTFKTSVALQRQMILSVAVEARLTEMVKKCASAWAAGGHSSAGCTLPLLTDWAWRRALTLKANADRLSVPLFDHSGQLPDANSARALQSCTTQLGHIAALLHTIVLKCSVFMLPEAVKETMQRQKAVQIVSLYFQVVQWFLNVGLLPEFHIDNRTHSEESDERLSYPVDSLVRFYQNRRFNLHRLAGENPATENLQDKSCALLFIDQFIKIECAEEKLKSLWIEDGSIINGLYPPPSLYSLLRTYLIPDMEEDIKHALVLYLLVDYAMIFDDNRFECVIRRLMQFPAMFGLSNTAIKVTQAFWHLDHRDFEFAVNQLQRVLAGGCLTQWQHNIVLSSLMVQKKTQSALQYLHVRKPTSSARNPANSASVEYDDWEACCNLYLSRGLLLQAFNHVRESLTNETVDVKEKRLMVFFKGCRKTKSLSKLLEMTLSHHEEEVFIKYLKMFNDSHTNDLLVMYYLKKSRYIEARVVNEEMKHLTGKGQLPYDCTSDFTMKMEHVHKTNTRDLLVESYYETLPRITRKLAHYSIGNTSNHKMFMPTPMTVNIQENNSKQVSYKSSVIQANIDKARQTWSEKPIIAHGLNRVLQVENTPFICSPKMPSHSRPSIVEKMSTTPDGDTLLKEKRRKMDDSQSVETVLDPKLKKEMEQLLHTPTIQRKSRRCSVDRTSVHREATPQSILKVKRMLERAITPLDGRHLVETDDEIETASQQTQSDNLSRSIRFNIPSASGTPSPTSDCGIEMNETFSNLFSLHAYRHHSQDQSSFPSNVGASPRKSIHHSCEKNIHTSIANTVSTPVKDRSQNRERILVTAPSSLNTSANEDVCSPSLSAENLPLATFSPEISSKDFKIPEIISRLNLIKNNHGSHPEISTDKDFIKSYIEERSLNITKSFANNISERYANQLSRDVTENETELIDVDKSRIEAGEEAYSRNSPDKSYSTDVRRQISPRGPLPRRSLRHTPERETDRGSNFTPTPRRSLRQRSRTPEIESPNKEKSTTPRSIALQTSSRKSLARKVMESNILRTTDVTVSTVVTRKEVVGISESFSGFETSHVNAVLDVPTENGTGRRDSQTASKYLDSMRTQNITSPNSDSILWSDRSADDVLDVSPSVDLAYVSGVARLESDDSYVVSKETKYDSFNSAENTSMRSKILKDNSTPSLQTESLKEVEKSSLEPHKSDIPPGKREKDNDHDVDSGSSNDTGSDSAPLVMDLQSDAENIKNVKIDEQTDRSENNLDESILNSDSDSCAGESHESDKADSAQQSDSDEKQSVKDSVDIENEMADQNNSEDEGIDREQEEVSEEEDKNSDSSDNIDEEIETEQISDDEENVSSEESQCDDAEENASESCSSGEVGSQKVCTEDESSEDIANQAYVDSGSDVICLDSSISNGEASVEQREKETVTSRTSQSPSPLDVNVVAPDTESNSALPQFSSISRKTDLTSTLLEKPTGDSVVCVSQCDIAEPSGNVDKQIDVNEPNDISKIQADDVILNSVEPSEILKPAPDLPEENSELAQPKVDMNNTSLMTEESSILDDSSFSLKYSGDEDTNEVPAVKVQTEYDDPICDDPPVGDEKTETENFASVNNQEMSTKMTSSASSPAKNEPPVITETESNISNAITNDTNVKALPEAIEKPSLVENTIDPPVIVHSQTHANKLKRRSSSSSGKDITKNMETDPLIEDKTVINYDHSKNLKSDLLQEVCEEKLVSPSSSQSNKTPPGKKKAAADSEADPNESLPLSEASISQSTRSASKKRLNKSATDNKKQPKTRKLSRKSTSSDDNNSVVSESNSLGSPRDRSKLDTSFVSESASNEDVSSRRKSRKSIFTFVKPNLSVIPEVSHLEPDKTGDTTAETINDYSSSRRLTRHQRSMLEKTIEASPSRHLLRGKKSRASSLRSEGSTIHEDSESEGSDGQAEASDTLDPIKLLDKEDFKGIPDSEEGLILDTVSVSSRASSIASDYAHFNAATPKRAKSETGSIAALRKSRKKSVDLDLTEKAAMTPTDALDDSMMDSPSRPRRQSFNRAVEALSTPRKNRKTSTDSKDIDGGSDVSTAGSKTPNRLRESRISEIPEGKPQKLFAIAESDDKDETRLTLATPPKAIRRGRKAASIHGYNMTSPDLNDSDIKRARAARKGRMSQLLTPLSKEEMINMAELEKPRFRRRTVHKITNPIQFVMKKN